MNKDIFTKLVNSLSKAELESDFAHYSKELLTFLGTSLKEALIAGDRAALGEIYSLFIEEESLFKPSGRMHYLSLPLDEESIGAFMKRVSSVLLLVMERRFFNPYHGLELIPRLAASSAELESEISGFIRLEWSTLYSLMPDRESKELLMSRLIPPPEWSAGSWERLSELAAHLREAVRLDLYDSRELREALFSALIDSLSAEQLFQSSYRGAAALGVKNRTLLAAALISSLPPYLYPLVESCWPFDRLDEEEMRGHHFKPLIEMIAELAAKALSEGLLALEDELEGVDEPLLKRGIQWIVDGVAPCQVRAMLTDSLNSSLEELERRNRLIIKGLLSLQAGDNPGVLETILYGNLTNREREYYQELKAHFELGEPVDRFPMKGQEHLILYLISLSEMARREGLLALEAEAESSPDPLIRLGLFMVLEGSEPELVEELLSLYNNSLLWELKLFSRTIIEGVILIQSGCPATLIGPILTTLIPFYRELEEEKLPPALSLESKIREMEQVRKRALACNEPFEAAAKLNGISQLEALAVLYLKRPASFLGKLYSLGAIFKRVACLEALSEEAGLKSGEERGELERALAKVEAEKEELLKSSLEIVAPPSSRSVGEELEEELQNSINRLVAELEALPGKERYREERAVKTPEPEEVTQFIREVSNLYRRRRSEEEALYRELKEKSSAELSRLAEQYLGEIHTLSGFEEEEPEIGLIKELFKQGLADPASIHRALSAEESSSLLSSIYSFDDLARLSDREIQLILRELDIGRLAIALKGAPDEILERVKTNMASRGAALLEEEIEFIPPISKEEQKEARDYISRIIFTVLSIP